MHARGLPARRTLLAALAAECLALAAPASGLAAPSAGLGPQDLAVVVNVLDPLSRSIADYYVRRRGIPARNVARVSFRYARNEIPAAEFAALKAEIDAQVPSSIQAYVITWARPWRVDCMSITAAMALGFEPGYCGHGCVTTQLSRYYNSSARRPFDELQMRPAMSLAAQTQKDAEDLIDRGIAADGTYPRASAYLLISGDAARDVRAALYSDAVGLVGARLNVEVMQGDALRQRRDVLFYFIGAVQVPDIESNQFLPGAIADHLTSYGGVLEGPSSQMSSMRWLQMGATGSYGTVVEPCNFTTKFPNPGLLMSHYLQGETLIESYWKSVAMPGQGVFIGEPLAAPFRGRASP